VGKQSVRDPGACRSCALLLRLVVSSALAPTDHVRGRDRHLVPRHGPHRLWRSPTLPSDTHTHTQQQHTFVHLVKLLFQLPLPHSPSVCKFSNASPLNPPKDQGSSRAHREGAPKCRRRRKGISDFLQLLLPRYLNLRVSHNYLTYPQFSSSIDIAALAILPAFLKCLKRTSCTLRDRGKVQQSIRSPGARASMPAHTIFAPILLPPPIYHALMECDFIFEDIADLVYLATIQPSRKNTIKMRMAILKVPRHLVSRRSSPSSSQSSGIPGAPNQVTSSSHAHTNTNSFAGRGTKIVKLGESSILGIS
jgi:hypothetical protein